MSAAQRRRAEAAEAAEAAWVALTLASAPVPDEATLEQVYGLLGTTGGRNPDPDTSGHTGRRPSDVVSKLSGSEQKPDWGAASR